MSGYQGDRNRPGYDRRERSPRRDDRRPDRREDRSYGGPRQESRGSRGSFDSRRGSSQGDYSTRTSGTTMSTSERLPNLPTTVELPKSGARFKPKIPELAPHLTGTAGHAYRLLVNHFTVQSLPVVKIYQYDIRMTVPPSSQRRGSEKVSAYQQAKVLPRMQAMCGPQFVFDGVSLGWSPKEIIPVEGTRSATIDLEGHSSEKPNQVEIAIRNSGSLKIKNLVNHVQSGSKVSNDPAVEDCFKAFNAVYRQDPAERFITRPKGQGYFSRSPELTMSLKSTAGVLEALRGMHQSVGLSFGRITLNVDTLVTAFYTPDLSFLDVAMAFAGVRSRADLARATSPDTFSRLIGMYFVVKHLDQSKNSKKMRVQGLVKDGARGTYFDQLDRTTGQTTKTNVHSYFQRKYSIDLQYPDLPLLKTRDGLFPMELTYTASGERYKEPLQGSETADFIKFATAPAYVRSQQIIDNVKRLHWHELKIPDSFGLSVAPQMLDVPSRILPCPLPKYSYGTDAQGPESGAWNLRNKTLLRPKSFISWGLMYLPGRNLVDDSTLLSFMGTLSTSLASLGMGTPKGLPAFLKGNPQGDLEEAIRHLYTKTGNTFQKRPDVFLFLIHLDGNPGIYRAIKNTCETVLGVASQVMAVDKALNKKGAQQYCANIGLKINCKLGGTNHIIVEPLFKRSRCMMLGADTSHPSAGQLRQNPPPPSYSALCASYDAECATYTAVCTSQAATVELIGDFQPMLKELFQRYRTMNKGQLPERVLFWRDGIADSQVPQFMDTEVKALQNMIKETGQPIGVTVVNCVKRHHTRLFPGKGERGDRNGNVPPGTVVEASNGHDIFLVTQAALQGTVRPTRYTVLYDENNLSADDFQRIATNLTFSYGRATRSVGLVPPVYYADQVCERGKLHLRSSAEGSVLHDVTPDLYYTMYWQ